MKHRKWVYITAVVAVAAFLWWSFFLLQVASKTEEQPETPLPIPQILEQKAEDRGAFAHIFNSMSYDTIDHETNTAEAINLGYGLEIHKCWCYGIKVRAYDKEYDWGDTLVNNIRVIQNPDTKDLIITDQENFVAFYDTKDQITFTQVVDGSSTLRREEYSVYFWNTGNVDLVWVAEDGETKTAHLRDNWMPIEALDTPTTLDEMIQVKDKFSSWLLVKSLNLGEYQ